MEAYSSQQPSALAPEDRLDVPGSVCPSHLPAGQREEKPVEDGYEVMKIIGPRRHKHAGSPASAGTVNLILNLSHPGDSLVQVLEQPAQAAESADESAQRLHRVREWPATWPHQVAKHRTFILPLPFLFPPQHAVPPSPAYKNFWRRCQGLLENTLGSLKRRKKVYRQSANEVKGVV